MTAPTAEAWQRCECLFLKKCQVVTCECDAKKLAPTATAPTRNNRARPATLRPYTARHA